MDHTYVFGYGSLMNEESLQKTLPGKHSTSWAILNGYKRAFNKAGRKNHRYLNIKQEPNSKVEGVLVEVTQEEFEELKKREHGYNAIDVTNKLESKPLGNTAVYAFAAAASSLGGLKVSRKYLDTVLAALPPEKQAQWIQETDFEGAQIDEDA
ncbi:MAG: gamma-glutamylcyclotransferase family protein [bacterium]|nr:gamma-glutamylcyclotransferase family protein [bacterium]